MPAQRSGGWTRGAMVAMAVVVVMVSAETARARGSRMIPYAEARQTFQRLGYQPFFMPGADICDADDPRCYPELESCAKSRTYACIYTWRRGRSIIEVETRYDHPIVARSECIVNCTPAAMRVKRTGRTASATNPPTKVNTD